MIYQMLAHWMLALMLTILTAPLLLLAIALLKLSTNGPILRSKECAGLGGRPFPLYSLRLGDAGSKWNGPQRFVARWRLHALPLLWNILRGEICFVGPRPERRVFSIALSERIPFYQQRLAVKPGITGWAQINLSRETPEDTASRLEYDLFYVKHFSRGLDAYILLHTFRGLLFASAS